MRSFDIFFVVNLNKLLKKKTVEFLVIWDAMTLTVQFRAACMMRLSTMYRHL